MQTQDPIKTARKGFPEFAPLDLARAEELKRLINLAAGTHSAVVIDPREGVRETIEPDLISPNEKTNALKRFERHY
jgi:hypothetical protein